MLFRFVSFVLANACVFVFFAVLWVWQYHINSDVSDRIDLVVVPYAWLAGFFAASFVTLGRMFPKLMTILISLGSSIVLSGVLFLVKTFVLAPFFDPMF
jgi:hypothetical protein